MIGFDFDRAKTRQRLATYSAILLGSFAFMLLSWDLLLVRVIGQNWAWVVLVLISFVALHTTSYSQWVGTLGRGLRRRGTALVINQEGIVDNASDYTLGQLTWGEIEKMYPWDWKTWLLVNRPSKMPVLTKERGIVIVFKDEIDFEPRYRNKPWITRSAYKEKLGRGRKRWIFIPDVLLTVTADELMTRLNDFYTTQVRGPV